MSDVVKRIYANFRGVDFRGDEINLVRSPDALNVWKDYKETESIRTRPGLALHTAFPEQVYGIYFFKGMIVHSGNKLYKDGNVIFTGCKRAKSNGFVYEDKWYFKDGVNYLEYDGTTIKKVTPYIPTTSIGRSPAGGGTTYEDVNMLSSRRKNTFIADGAKGEIFLPDTGSTEYYLDTQNIDEGAVPFVTVDGALVNNFTVDYAKGMIKFDEPPMAPATTGQDNVTIEFQKTTNQAEKIMGCTILQVFDNRVFFSGNPDFPNVLWHCSLNDPGYISDLDYYQEGLDRAKINGMVAGNNALWVFREPSEANTSVFYHTPTLDADYGKIYPSAHSSVTIGCIGKAINFNDDIVFFSERGMEGVSGDITTEQAVAHRSSLIDRKLLGEADYANMVLEEWEGYLLIIIGNKIYLADSRAVFTNENHMEYEFFYWEMEKPITSAKVHEGILYVGTKDGVYTLTDNECNVESYWVTPKDKFKSPNMLKTTNKRGCVAEATGDITVYAKVEDTDFEEIGAYEKVSDYFVSRIKRKKFKDIQLKFYSKTRFSLETVTLEAIIGGYIKR